MKTLELHYPMIQFLITLLIHPKPHIHVKNPLSENMTTRLRMYKVLLFKFRRYLCKVVYDISNYELQSQAIQAVSVNTQIKRFRLNQVKSVK